MSFVAFFTIVAADPFQPVDPIEKALEPPEELDLNDKPASKAHKDASKFICCSKPKWVPKKGSKGSFWKTVVKYKSKSGPDGAMVVNLGEDKNKKPQDVIIKGKKLPFCS